MIKDYLANVLFNPMPHQSRLNLRISIKYNSKDNNLRRHHSKIRLSEAQSQSSETDHYLYFVSFLSFKQSTKLVKQYEIDVKLST